MGRFAAKVLIAIFAIAGVVILILSFFVEQTAITISARTQGAEVEIVDDDISQIFAFQVWVSDEAPGNAASFTKHENATIHFRSGAVLAVSRTGAGPIFIEVLSEPDGSPAGLLSSGSKSPLVLRQGSLLRFEASQREPHTFLLPFRGRISFGEDVGPRVTSVLLEGEVLVIEKPMWFGERYVARRASLDPGDRVSLASRSDVAPVAAGFVIPSDRGAMQVTAHAAADMARIERFGSAGYSIRASAWNRLPTHPALSVATLVIAFLAALTVVGVEIWRALIRGE